MPTTILDNETYPEALHRRYAEESRIDRKIEIIAMAKAAGFFEFNVEGWVKEFERFAALVAAHERAKDLTDDEVEALAEQFVGQQSIALCRAVIAADREKNK